MRTFKAIIMGLFGLAMGLGGVACLTDPESTETLVRSDGSALLNIGDPCGLDSQCDDGLFCNGAETCTNGRCVAGTEVNCDDANDCTKDDCGLNGCVHEAYLSPHTCSQQPLGYCHGPTCVSGMGNECVPTSPCPPCGGECAAPVCENGYYVSYALPNGTLCNDGQSACYDGVCAECTTNAQCDDGNGCTIDVCSPAGICTHTNNDLAACANGFCWAGSCCAASGGVPGCIDHQQPDPDTGLGACVLATSCTAGLGCNLNHVCN